MNEGRLRKGMDQVPRVIGHLAVEAHEQHGLARPALAWIAGVAAGLAQQLGQQAEGFAGARLALDAHQSAARPLAGMLQNGLLVGGGGAGAVQHRVQVIGFAHQFFHGVILS
ncbi:hypothetical protein [Adlercreutzia shanghongiae]|uniref:hypothetical protein n=1 Tax=Adlercreutzia shanghongiae TaxID=3111773 RepID=UPI003898E378